MNKSFRCLVLFLAIIVLCSCASGVPYTQLNPNTIADTPEKGRIFFYRTTTLGAALQPDIILNGKPIGKSIAQGFFFKDCLPGDYTVVTSTEVKRKASFVMDEGQTRYIRFNVSMGFFVGHVYPELIDPQDAIAEIQNCKFTGEAVQTD